MGKAIALVLLALASALAWSCAGDDKVSCASVCEKRVSCEADTSKEECIQGCEQYLDYLRPEAFQTTGKCIEGMSCAQMSESDDVCIQKAVEAAPEDALAGTISAICAKINACVPTVAVASCEAMFSTPTIAEAMGMMKIVKQSYLDCAADCYDALDCSALGSPAAYGAEFENCTVSCGLVFDE